MNPAVAIEAFRIQRELLCESICHCLPLITDQLYSTFMISRDARERACNSCLTIHERTGILLDCVEARLETVPSDFAKFIEILKSDRYLQPLAENVIKSYRELLFSLCCFGALTLT